MLKFIAIIALLGLTNCIPASIDEVHLSKLDSKNIAVFSADIMKPNGKKRMQQCSLDFKEDDGQRVGGNIQGSYIFIYSDSDTLIIDRFVCLTGLSLRKYDMKHQVKYSLEKGKINYLGHYDVYWGNGLALKDFIPYGYYLSDKKNFVLNIKDNEASLKDFLHNTNTAALAKISNAIPKKYLGKSTN